MSRLSAGEQTAISAQAIQPFHLIKIEFDGGTQYLTDFEHDLSYDSQTWSANGFILGVPSVAETFEFKNNTLNFKISNVDQTFLTVARSEQIINRKITIYKGLFASGAVSFATIVFAGYIESYTSSAREMGLSVAGLFVDFERTNGRFMGQASQDRYIEDNGGTAGDDLGFEFAAQNNKQLIWGVN